MERKVVSGIMLTLLLIGMLTLAFNIQQVKASGTIYIRADGSVEPEGTPISSIDNITYTFTDNIYDEIVVERDNIVLDGAGYTLQGTGFYDPKGIYLLDRSNVTIKNVEIELFWYGIYLDYSSNCTVSGNSITNNNQTGIRLDESSNISISGNNIEENINYGIELYESSYNSISRNTVTNNGHGIKLGGSLYLFSHDNTISGNNITANNGNGLYLYKCDNNNFMGNNLSNNNFHGILLSYSSNNTLTDNIASNNRYNFGISGYDFSDFNNHIDTSNTVDGKPIYYLKGVSHTVYDAQTNVGTFCLIKCNNITIKDLTLTKNGHGVFLWNSTNNKMENISATNNQQGIWLDHSSNNTLIGNNVSSNEDDGIGLYYSINNTLTYNTAITSNNGIRLYHSSNNTITRNTVTNNDWEGIGFHDSNNNTFASNFLSNNGYGFRALRSSNNTITDNTIINNNNGIVFGISRSGASNNTVYHNNFINNTEQARNTESLNTWDNGYPSGGNYWSDYVDRYPDAEEIDDSGIWDTPYVIDENNQDPYPLISPPGAMMWVFNVPTPIQTYQVRIYSNSSISGFHFDASQKQLTYNVIGQLGTVGFCNITIPRQLLWCDTPQEWIILVNSASVPYVAIENDNFTHLYFTYSHSIHQVQIIGTHVIHIEFSGPVYIKADGSVDPPTAPISTVDNVIYTLTGNITSDYSGIVVERDNIVVDGAGYTVKGTRDPYTRGIELRFARENVTVKNTNVINFHRGIVIYQDRNITLIGNNVSKTEWGILIEQSQNNILIGNTMSNNTFNFGVLGNEFSDFNNYVDTSNTVDSKPIYYLIDASNVIVNAQTNAGTIYLINCNNITVRDLILTKNWKGVFLWNTTNSKIENVTTLNNRSGFRLDDSSSNVIFGNEITSNIWGNLLEYSDNNMIVDNVFSNNTIGIRLFRSSNNKIFHNSFINNTQQVWDASYVSVNTWDDGYPSGGNHWSDCEEKYPDAEEIDGSGIWNTPYEIDENNQDNYPLMNPWVVPPPTDTTPPTISIVSPENKTYTVEDVPLTFTVSESTSWIGYSLDGQANVTITGNTTLSGLSDGSHSLKVYAEDTAGNTGASELIYFTIETQQAESFPIWIVAVIVIIAALGTAIYLLKIRRKG